jgi:hypothetical protein
VSLGAAENSAVEHLLVRHPEAEYSLGRRHQGLRYRTQAIICALFPA